jgi:UPF0755 protein
MLLAAAFLGESCSGGAGRDRGGGPVAVEIPRGATTMEAGRRLQGVGLVDHPRLFTLYVALRGAEGRLKAGRYRLERDAGWGTIASALERGAVETVAMTVPEGFTVREIAPRIAGLSGVPVDSVLSLARDSAFAARLGVPGPTLEGYLFPETYRFAEGLDPRRALRTMVDRYRDFWTPRRRARADSLGLSEREAVTLASIVEAEARIDRERPLIAAVYFNRLDRGMLLQADPTVQYALEEPVQRLLYAHIRQVADDPYNTYTNRGLPPGPIGSPGAASLRAVLRPADVSYLYFVARPDGSHVFSRTLRQHNRAKNRIRRGEPVPPREPSTGGPPAGEGSPPAGEGGPNIDEVHPDRDEGGPSATGRRPSPGIGPEAR